VKRALAIIGVGVVLVASACSSDSQYDATHDDTGYHGRDYTDKNLIMLPDGYPNIASLCDPYTEGIRLYIPSRKDGASAIVTAVDDPTCHMDLSQVNYDKSYRSPDKP
jgi:hypothetical protein